MLQFKVAQWRQVDPAEDEMSRSWVGWTPQLGDQQIYDQNRGMWVLGPRADRERYAAFAALPTGLLTTAVAIDRIDTYPSGKRAIVGQVLGPGDPFYDSVIGQPALDAQRNPVTYHPDPAGLSVPGAGFCGCGCGEPVDGRRLFRVGHDQRAIRERVNRHWADPLAFIQWIDANTHLLPAIERPADLAQAIK